MSTPETAPIPDIFGHTTFCDDIRHEVDGKFTFIGVYSGSMFVRSAFPVVLPKFGINVMFFQKIAIFDPLVSLRIFLPGDAEDAPSIEAEVQQAQASPPIAPLGELAVMGTNMILAPLQINEAGPIKVRILRQGILHRLGSLNVQALPPTTVTPNASGQPSELFQRGAPEK
jgi:hypothetical protein